MSTYKSHALQPCPTGAAICAASYGPPELNSVRGQPLSICFPTPVCITFPPAWVPYLLWEGTQ